MINRGNALIKLKRPADALANYDRVLALEPEHAVGLTARGVALTLMDRYDDALSLHERALLIKPDLVSAHINRGNTLVGLTRMREAIGSYADAIAIEPENAEANFNASITRLCVGDFAEGWKQYEYRWKKKDVAADRPTFDQPMWRGEKDLHGKTVLLLGEQGFGDTIQFMRYAPMVADAWRESDPRRTAAAQPSWRPRARYFNVLGDGEALPSFDFYCPLLSLPLAFGTELTTVPAKIPYLGRARSAWTSGGSACRRMAGCGLDFAGQVTPSHLNDRNRSMPLDRLAPTYCRCRGSTSSACKKR